MFEKAKLGLNDEELDDYRDFDDEHTERGSKLDDFGADEDEDDADEVAPETPGTAETPAPASGEPKPAAPWGFNIRCSSFRPTPPSAT